MWDKSVIHHRRHLRLCLFGELFLSVLVSPFPDYFSDLEKLRSMSFLARLNESISDAIKWLLYIILSPNCILIIFGVVLFTVEEHIWGKSPVNIEWRINTKIKLSRAPFRAYRADMIDYELRTYSDKYMYILYIHTIQTMQKKLNKILVATQDHC